MPLRRGKYQRNALWDASANKTGRVRALYVHFPACFLDPDLQYMNQKMKMCRNCFCRTCEFIIFVTSSPNRLDLFQEFQRQGESAKLRPFCHGRCTLRISFFRYIVWNYSHLIIFLCDLAWEVWKQVAAKDSEFQRTVAKFDTWPSSWRSSFRG